MRPPGQRLLAFARLIIDPAAVARVLEPLVADWQREWLTSSTSLRRVIVRTRGFIAFLCSATYCVLVDDVPSDVRRRASIILGAFVALGTLLLIVPYAEAPVEVMAYLLPSMLCLSVPFAVFPLAMLLGASGNRSFLARTTIAIALLVFVLHNWITPYANHAFREHMVFRQAERAGKVAEYRSPRRGLGELTLSEVLRESLASSSAIASQSKVREELLRRMSLPVVPVLLAMMGWGLTRVSRSAKPVRLFGWWAFACISYGLAISLGMTLERWWSTPREVATLLPLVLWFGAIVVLMRSTPSAAGGAAFDSAQAKKAPPLPMPRHR